MNRSEGETCATSVCIIKAGTYVLLRKHLHGEDVAVPSSIPLGPG